MHLFLPCPRLACRSKMSILSTLSAQVKQFSAIGFNFPELCFFQCPSSHKLPPSHFVWSKLVHPAECLISLRSISTTSDVAQSWKKFSCGLVQLCEGCSSAFECSLHVLLQPLSDIATLSNICTSTSELQNVHCLFWGFGAHCQMY